ncbi:PCC domain-containing protein [Lampropedia aestuarii]|uniref:PCC domain-containing protein n=1 Tax=Lampropedia aestuarii TaxID=2562762 RepID=UPI00246931AB|nr:DUF296 domain-containing protein [Lampropedia aestuarii]MDH5858185.1 DUF296 domain-containing protein [Lampropedia aestuarii]
MRSIHHFGTPELRRHNAVPCQLHYHADVLPTGLPLREAFARLCALRGASSAVARLEGGSFGPLAYVMPALSNKPEFAVFYSDRYEAVVPAQIESATVTIGLRDGQSWLHCHAVWIDAQGERKAGHVLPDDAWLSEAPQMHIWYLQGANFDVLPCTESRFSLFTPVPALAAPAAASAVPTSTGLAVTIRPNEDVCEAIATICREHGIRRAVVRGGVGSLVGVSFADGREVEAFVTEVLIEQGTVDTSLPGGTGVTLDVALVDYLHGIHSGRLKPGANPVLVTFEMVIERVDAQS